MLNSLGIALVYTLLAGTVCTLAGYGFATYRFRGREACFGLLMLGLVVPAQITLVPLFQMMAELHWLNTYQAVVAPTWPCPSASS
ncbi:hypothetical protein [Streptomyces showdoensis]|uniref:hypothetical protein n=1 Tax=Streptomyces showdoensis TaxID=68268 RepID=UPI0031EE656D